MEMFALAVTGEHRQIYRAEPRNCLAKLEIARLVVILAAVRDVGPSRYGSVGSG